MHTEKKNLLLSALLIALYAVTYMFLHGKVPNVNVTYTGMSIGTILLFCLFLRKIPFPFYAAFVLFAMFAQYFGSMLGGYHSLWCYDLILHFSSGLLLVLAGHLLYQYLWRGHDRDGAPHALPLCFSALFSIACAGLWEVYEFTADHILHIGSQGDLIDTMTDVIAGTGGALLGGLLLYLFLRRRHVKAAQKQQIQEDNMGAS